MRVLVLGEGVLANRIRHFLNNMGVLTEYVDTADYVISAQHEAIMCNEFINRFEYVLNIHFSDTAVMRGCNMMSHAIVNGDKKTAVTFHRIIDDGIDSGPVVAKVEVPILDTDTSKILYDRCVEMAYARFVDLWEVLKRKPDGTPQKELGRYYGRSELITDVFIDQETDRVIRSLLFDELRSPNLVIGGRRYKLKEIQE